MSYVHITRAPGLSMADYQSVRDAMGDDPIEGHVLHIVGTADGALHVIDVWESKASADRFAAERLFPTFHKLGVGPTPEATYTDFETDDLILEKVGP